MNKRQFIYRNGLPVTVTKLDGTSYSTYALYHHKARASQYSSSFTFSTNYMRDGTFRPTDNVASGYMVSVPSTNEQTFVVGRSDEIFAGVKVAATAELLVINYPSVQLQRKQVTYDVNLNPTSSTWTTVGAYPMNADYHGGNLTYKAELLLPTTVLIVLMQNTVPVQKMDRLVVGGTNYQVDAFDNETSIGLVFAQVSLDMRT